MEICSLTLTQTSCYYQELSVYLPLFIPRSTKLKRGKLDPPCPSIRPSVCGLNRVCSVSSTILTGSIWYLFWTSEGVSRITFLSKIKKRQFWQILWICNFDFVLFWLRIQYELVYSMGNNGAAGVYSERRRASCSSSDLHLNMHASYGGMCSPLAFAANRQQFIRVHFWAAWTG